MTRMQREKGARGEREVAGILNDLTGWTWSRTRTPGVDADVGDLWCAAVPWLVVEVKNWADTTAAVREGRRQLLDACLRRDDSGDLYVAVGALFVRYSGGRWEVVMEDPDIAWIGGDPDDYVLWANVNGPYRVLTPEQFAGLLREAA